MEEDRFVLASTEEAITRANLKELQAEREKVEGHIQRLAIMIQRITEQMIEAEKVPEQNAEGFRSLISILYPLSCFPVLGFLATWFLLYKVESFASAFSSTNRVYSDLRVELLERNARFRKINTYLFINIIAALLYAQVDKKSQSLLSSMKAAVEGCEDSLLYRGHFACDLVDQAVVEGFFRGDLRQAAASVREHISGSIGEVYLQELLEVEEDRFVLASTEEAITRANLKELQAEREKVEGHIQRLAIMIQRITEQMIEAEKVPEQNAEGFRSLISILYPLSWRGIPPGTS